MAGRGQSSRLRKLNPRGCSGRARGRTSSSRPRAPPPPPPPPAPRYEGPIRPILPPRYVDFLDLEEVDDAFSLLFAFHGLYSFMADHRTYYPDLVQEFYGNMQKNGDTLVTRVRGLEIVVNEALFVNALDVANAGAVLGISRWSEAQAVWLLTMVEPPAGDGRHMLLNSNQCPPLQKIMHHMMTTILFPKGGARDEVTTVHLFMFYCLFGCQHINLPALIMRKIEEVWRIKKRSLPYAAQLTAVFRNLHIPLGDYQALQVKQVNIYNVDNLCRFMHFKVVDGQFVRDTVAPQFGQQEEEEAGESEGGEEGENDEEEEMEADRDAGQGIPEAAAHGDRYITAAEWGQRQDYLDGEVRSMRTDISNLTGSVATIGQELADFRQSHSSQMDTLLQLVRDLTHHHGPSSSQPPPQ